MSASKRNRSGKPARKRNAAIKPLASDPPMRQANPPMHAAVSQIQPSTSVSAPPTTERRNKLMFRIGLIGLVIAILSPFVPILWGRYMENKNAILFKEKEIESVTRLIKNIHEHPISVRQIFSKDFCFLHGWGKTDDLFYQSRSDVEDYFQFSKQLYFYSDGSMHLGSKNMGNPFRPQAILTSKSFNATKDSFIVNGKKIWMFKADNINSMDSLAYCPPKFSDKLYFSNGLTYPAVFSEDFDDPYLPKDIKISLEVLNLAMIDADLVSISKVLTTDEACFIIDCSSTRVAYQEFHKSTLLSFYGKNGKFIDFDMYVKIVNRLTNTIRDWCKENDVAID